MSKISPQANVTTAKSRPVENVTPPPGFCYVEESIARCTKLARQNLLFLRSYSFRVFVNVSGQELNSFVLKYANESAITVVCTLRIAFHPSTFLILLLLCTNAKHTMFVDFPMLRVKHSVFTGGQSPLTRNVSLFEEFIKSTLELVLDVSVNSPAVLIIGR
jgi:hypothetical protein